MIALLLLLGCGPDTEDAVAPEDSSAPAMLCEDDLDQPCDVFVRAASRCAVEEGFAERLEGSGCVETLAPFSWPVEAIPYELNAPLWTDGALKRRALFLPADTAVQVGADGLEFPEGTVLAKAFLVQADGAEHLVELRLLEREASGWRYGTYFDDGDGFVLQQSGISRELDVDVGSQRVRWLVPSEDACLSCHQTTEVLGPTLAQLNRTVELEAGQASQLALLNGAGVFEPPLDGSAEDHPRVPAHDSGSMADRARAVLHGNCAHCHAPGGYTPPDLRLDLRWDRTLEETSACDTHLQYASFGLGGDYIIKAGEPEESNLLQRMRHRGIGQMPPLGTYVVDEVGVAVVERWIRELECP